jgi:hypothetical protein
MKILCYVNQAECFRRGIDAQASSVKLEVDPSKLSEDIRAFIADHLSDNYKFVEFAIPRPDMLGFFETVLEQQAFDMAQKSAKKASEKYLHFEEWIKKVDEVSVAERKKLAETLAKEQEIPAHKAFSPAKSSNPGPTEAAYDSRP